MVIVLGEGEFTEYLLFARQIMRVQIHLGHVK
jgi:hypothetical protein